MWLNKITFLQSIHLVWNFEYQVTALLKLLEDINRMFCHFRVNLSYSEVQDREMVNSDTNNHNNKKIL